VGAGGAAVKFRIFTPDMEAGLRSLLPGDVNRDELQRIHETANRMNRQGPSGKLAIVGFTFVVLVMIVGIRFFVPMTWLGSYAGIGSYVITWMVLVAMFAGYIAWLQPDSDTTSGVPRDSMDMKCASNAVTTCMR